MKQIITPTISPISTGGARTYLEYYERIVKSVQNIGHQHLLDGCTQDELAIIDRFQNHPVTVQLAAWIIDANIETFKSTVHKIEGASVLIFAAYRNGWLSDDQVIKASQMILKRDLGPDWIHQALYEPKTGHSIEPDTFIPILPKTHEVKVGDLPILPQRLGFKYLLENCTQEEKDLVDSYKNHPVTKKLASLIRNNDWETFFRRTEKIKGSIVFIFAAHQNQWITGEDVLNATMMMDAVKRTEPGMQWFIKTTDDPRNFTLFMTSTKLSSSICWDEGTSENGSQVFGIRSFYDLAKIYKLDSYPDLSVCPIFRLSHEINMIERGPLGLSDVVVEIPGKDVEVHGNLQCLADAICHDLDHFIARSMIAKDQRAIQYGFANRLFAAQQKLPSYSCESFYVDTFYIVENEANETDVLRWLINIILGKIIDGDQRKILNEMDMDENHIRLILTDIMTKNYITRMWMGDKKLMDIGKLDPIWIEKLIEFYKSVEESGITKN